MKKVLLFIAVIFFTAATFAQDEVTLTVIGTGENEEKATLQALRSAIEQTFGAFVSANTTILNDEIVQDQVVSISTGNVTKYEKNAVITLPNGHISVSLNATVAINKLMSYAQSKGIKAEFAGASYATNAKLLHLKIQSIQKAYEILVQQLEHISQEMFDFELILGKHQRVSDMYTFDCVVDIYPNIASHNFRSLYMSTMKEFKLNESEIELCKQEGIPLVGYDSRLGAIFEIKKDEEDEEDKEDIPDIYKAEIYSSPYNYVEAKNLVLEKMKQYTCTIPVSPQLSDVLCQALCRYKIQEINNYKNEFKPTIHRADLNPDYRLMFLGTPDDSLSPIDVQYKLHFDKITIIPQYDIKQIRGTMVPEYLSCRILARPLEKEMKKELESKGMTEFTHEAQVAGSIIEQHRFTIEIPVDKMTTFQGFEVINASAPKEKFYITLPKEYRKKETSVRPEDL
jgi:hypothetical protein